ncbi:4868_t:CDS:2 [Entrophospora sp. SA101]|nr:4868_t:CDS:2 [Entrophospora sp. SA101]
MIHQNLGEIYQNIGNNNSVRQNMVHNIIYQNPEVIYHNVNVGDNNSVQQNVWFII